MKTRLVAVLAVLCTSCGYVPREVTPPASFTSALAIPPRPADPARPLAAVMWMLNYDCSQFDTVWAWLHTEVPEGGERARAIAAASLIALGELDRTDVRTEGLAAFDAAIAAFPTDARLPLWRAYIMFLEARDARDDTRLQAALEQLRLTSQEYPSFTLFGLTLAIGGWEGATPVHLDEARDAFEAVVADTNRMQFATGGLDLERSRRIFDTPIAPYNVPAMQAMIGDLELRAGKKEQAARAYFTALNANAAARWPWRAEVQRRLENLDAVMAGLAARPATEWTLGSRGRSAMGMATAAPDTRFGGRVGNGSCTVCHTHLSAFDLGEKPQEVGWVKVKVELPKEVPNLMGAAFLLPSSEMPVPGGFGLGPFVDTAAPRDFHTRDELFDGTYVIPAPAGQYFVAVQATVEGKTWQGYLPRELGKQWFIDVKPGVMFDVTEVPIRMKPLESK